jgi:hypothetical protein
MRSPVTQSPIRRAQHVTAFLTVLALAGNGSLLAQAHPAPAPATAPAPARQTGLPKKVTWTFNFDAGFGMFGFNNSLYTQARPDPSGNLGDNWMESYVKPALSGTFATGRSQLFGKLSVVGERTFFAPPTVVGTEASSFQIEDAYLGWRSGTTIGSKENELEFTVGRTQYRVGHGFLVWDGGGEGGSRGGYWSNARKAWQFAGVAAFRPKHMNFEAFYLDRDEVPESQTGTRLFGGNFELTLGGATTFGASYFHFLADPVVNPARDGMSVYNARLFTNPLRRLPGLGFELEYAREENGDLIKSTAFTGLASYELSHMGWKPKLSYRYAYFQGDDPPTTANERFDMLLPGFYDWGTWWQGEIGGEYFLSNSNLISHQVRLHVAPSARLGAGLIGYAFMLDQPVLSGISVTSKNLATELDAYSDWKLNSNFTVSVVAAFANPGEAPAQALARTANFTYGMIYVAYAF